MFAAVCRGTDDRFARFGCVLRLWCIAHGPCDFARGNGQELVPTDERPARSGDFNSFPFQGGLTITWSSVSGKTYSIRRTSNLEQPFILLGSKIAQDTMTSFSDTSAVGPGPYFYSLTVE